MLLGRYNNYKVDTKDGIIKFKLVRKTFYKVLTKKFEEFGHRKLKGK